MYIDQGQLENLGKIAIYLRSAFLDNSETTESSMYCAPNGAYSLLPAENIENWFITFQRRN